MNCTVKNCKHALIKKRKNIDGHIWFDYICPVHRVIETVKPDADEAWQNEE